MAFRTTKAFDARLEACAGRASQRAGVNVRTMAWAEAALLREIERDEAAAKSGAKGRP